MIRLYGWLFISFLLMTTPVRAEEIIHDFAVQASVHSDGQVSIIEDIKVTAEHYQINHGIYRDIPTEYTDRFGNRVLVPISITCTMRDGQKEDYHTTRQTNGLRIYLGNKDRVVSTGIHIYRICYDIDRAVGRFETMDELYWNVTGNGWIFPIEKASVDVIFPPDAVIRQTAGYSGAFGAHEQNFISRKTSNEYHAEISKRLEPYEGFTVAVGIEKGSIAAVSVAQRIKYFFFDNRAWIIFITSTFGLMLYLGLMWKRYGDDTPGLVIPRFDIPEGMTPSLLRYIWRQGYDRASLTANLIDAALKQYITITDTEDDTIIKQIRPALDVTSAELQFLSPLFSDGPEITLPKSGFSSSQRGDASLMAHKFLAARSKHQSYLDQFRKTYFTTNQPIKTKAILVMLLAIGLSFLWGHTPEQIAILVGSIVLLQGGMIILFWKPMNKYTKEGQRIADYAQGLRLYLDVAEEARLNSLYPADVTPEIFEKFLPYAFALGVEQKWSEAFARQIAKNTAKMTEEERTRMQGRQMGYVSRSLIFADLSSLSYGLGHLNDRISSASTPPASSSGSGGGGSSGGGGGGGGGGGW